MPRRFIVLAACVLAAGAAVAAWLAVSSIDTTFEFLLQDSVSGKWVWDSAIRLQDRLAYAFYQGDAAPVPLVFTRLKPGPATLQIEAPGYLPVSIPVGLRRGANRLERPVPMVGCEIPGLDHFVVFEQLEGADVVCELRPVGIDGHAVLNHPCLDIRASARMTVQLRDRLPIEEPLEKGWTRGRELFNGKIDWEWNSAPGAVFRYHARIPGARIFPDPAPYRVIDYLVVVPDPRRLTREELDTVLGATPPLSDMPALRSYLAGQGDRIRFFFDTSANVKGKEE